MSYSVRYEPEAWEDLINLPIQVQSRIIKKIDWLAENFDGIAPLGLTGNLADFDKLRVGDYRSIYELNNTEAQIIIVRIGHQNSIDCQYGSDKLPMTFIYSLDTVSHQLNMVILV
jgi:mRNA interferase RelE/StbE